MALEHFRMNKNEYVLVISDLRMPNLHGLDFFKHNKRFESLTRERSLMTAFAIKDGLFQDYARQDIINNFRSEAGNITRFI